MRVHAFSVATLVVVTTPGASVASMPE